VVHVLFGVPGVGVQLDDVVAVVAEPDEGMVQQRGAPEQAHERVGVQPR
jgi:hypothetical protein